MARPRSEEARRKALAAANDLIIERGVGNLTIEEVAARSGVAKTTIYRHWPERASLIIDTVRMTFEHVSTPDTGSLRGDLEAFFLGMVRADLSGKVGHIMPCLIDAASRDPEIEMLLDRISIERQQPILTMVERAQRRGELPPSLDTRVVIGTILGPIVFRKIVWRQPLDTSYVQSCLDVAITGLSALRPIPVVPVVPAVAAD
ncbi:MAG: TetR/AcrR family transcriptional regulator [Ilumatobacteraceae bacterium]